MSVQTTTTKPKTKARLFFLDNLRIFLTILVILHHAPIGNGGQCIYRIYYSSNHAVHRPGLYVPNQPAHHPKILHRLTDCGSVVFLIKWSYSSLALCQAGIGLGFLSYSR